MKVSITLRARRDRSQAGYILIAILFAVTLAIIALAAVVPSIKTAIQRDREEELIHRGHQYARAIQLFYRKFGRYPNSIEDLQDTNNLRFLRHKYTDPITGKDEWRLIRFGQAAVKPIPSYLKGATPAGGNPSSGTGSNGLATSNSTGATNASDISQKLPGSTMGGGPFVGVASTSDKQGLKEIDGKSKYSEWEFVYDPSLDTSRGGANTPNNNTPNPAQNGLPNGATPPPRPPTGGR